jgi:hypothetical protein
MQVAIAPLNLNLNLKFSFVSTALERNCPVSLTNVWGLLVLIGPGKG